MGVSFIPSFRERKTLQRLLQTFILRFAVYCSLCRYILLINKPFISSALGWEPQCLGAVALGALPRDHGAARLAPRPCLCPVVTAARCSAGLLLPRPAHPAASGRRGRRLWKAGCEPAELGLVWMWCQVAWLRGGLGGARLTVGLDGLKGLFQPEQLCDPLSGGALGTEVVRPWSTVQCERVCPCKPLSWAGAGLSSARRAPRAANGHRGQLVLCPVARGTGMVGAGVLSSLGTVCALAWCVVLGNKCPLAPPLQWAQV